MSTRSKTKAKAPTKGSDPNQLIPPEEAFWVRYSPHHEFSLSSLGSLILHLLSLGLIVVLAILAARLSLGDKPPETGGLEIVEGGGGGNPLGVGDGSGKGVIPRGQDVVETVKPNETHVTTPPAVTPKDIVVRDTPPTPVEVKPNEDTDRLINTDALVGQLEEMKARTKGLREQLEGRIAGQGKGGTGRGGGKGEGVGTGEGAGVGPGTGRMNQRQKRQLRWIMMFNTYSGGDYANQLAGLGAILGVQQTDGSFMLYENLKQRPVQGAIRDLAGLDRIYWIDDKPESVQSLTRALGMVPIPTAVIAFFPKELEEKLARLETDFFKRRNPGAGSPEDSIKETFFQVKQVGLGRYEPIVIRQN